MEIQLVRMQQDFTLPTIKVYSGTEGLTQLRPASVAEAARTTLSTLKNFILGYSFNF